MAQQGGADMGMGPNLASVQSLLDSTRDRAGAGGEGGDDDKSALAIMSAVMAVPTEAMKSDIPGHLSANIDRAVTSIGANITPQVSLCSSSKGNSFLFGFPALFDGLGEGAGEDASMSSEDYMSGDAQHQDPWSFDEYPHADETIGPAASGLDGVYHDGMEAERSHYQDFSPMPSPDVHQPSPGEEHGM